MAEEAIKTGSIKGSSIKVDSEQVQTVSKSDSSSSISSPSNTKTELGKSIDEMKTNLTDFDVDYYPSGSVRSIKSKPVDYLSTNRKRKTKSGKRYTKIPASASLYEIYFREDGTKEKEITKQIIKTYDRYNPSSSGYSDTQRYEAKEDFVVDYDPLGNPIKKTNYDPYEDLNKDYSDGGTKETFNTEPREVWDYSNNTYSKYDKSNKKIKQSIGLQKKIQAEQAGLTLDEYKELEEKDPATLAKVLTDTSAKQGSDEGSSFVSKDPTKSYYGQEVISKNGEIVEAKYSNMTETERRFATIKEKQVEAFRSELFDSIKDKQERKYAEDIKQMLDDRYEAKIAPVTSKVDKWRIAPTTIASPSISVATALDLASYQTKQREAEKLKAQNAWGITKAGKAISAYGQDVVYDVNAGRNIFTGEKNKYKQSDNFITKVKESGSKYVETFAGLTVGKTIKTVGELTSLVEPIAKGTPSYLKFVAESNIETISGLVTDPKKKLNELGTGALFIGGLAYKESKKGLSYAGTDIVQRGGVNLLSGASSFILTGELIGLAGKGISKGYKLTKGVATNLKVARLNKAIPKGSLIVGDTAKQVSKLGDDVYVAVQPVTKYRYLQRTTTEGGKTVDDFALFFGKSTAKSSDDLLAMQVKEIPKTTGVLFKGKSAVSIQETNIGSVGVSKNIPAINARATSVGSVDDFFAIPSKELGKVLKSNKPIYTYLDDTSKVVTPFANKGFTLQRISPANPATNIRVVKSGGGDIIGFNYQSSGGLRLGKGSNNLLTAEVKQLGLRPQPFAYTDRSLSPAYEFRGLYTYQGAKPIKIFEAGLPVGDVSIYSKLASAGTVTSGGVTVSVKGYKPKRIFFADDLLSKPKGEIISSAGSDQVTILKNPKTQTKTTSVSSYESSSVSGSQEGFYDLGSASAPVNDVFNSKQFKEGFKESPSSSTGNKIKPKSSPIFKPILSPSVDINSGIDFNSDFNFDNKINQDLGTSATNKYDVGIDSGIDSAIKTDSLIDTKQDLSLRQDLKFKQDSIFDQRIKTDPPKEPTENKKPKVKFRSSPKRSSGSLFAFATEVKVGKKFVRLNKFFKSEEQAESFGGEFVGKRALRSFRTIKVQKKGQELEKSITSPLNKNKFYRKSSGVWVEKSKYAIDTQGELSEITFKGIASNKRSLFSKKKKSGLDFSRGF